MLASSHVPSGSTRPPKSVSSVRCPRRRSSSPSTVVFLRRSLLTRRNCAARCGLGPSGFLVLFATAILTLVLVACTSSSIALHNSNNPSAPVATTQKSNMTTPPCSSAAVRGIVGRFIEAFNGGKYGELERLWASAGEGFDWYSTDRPGQRIRADAKDRATLIAYFRDRHAKGERLDLTSFQFNGINAAYGNFQVLLLRRAADLPPTRYAAKGAVVCDSRPLTLGVWSMAKVPNA